MPRTRRRWISQNAGSFHIISRTTGDDTYFDTKAKEYFLQLLERLASGFFVNIHAFCIMGNHFHILATGLDLETKKATEKELYRRYRLMYGKHSDPPTGSYHSNGQIIPDEDGGIERLRHRLGSISRFVQELKQSFTIWYNIRHDRKGYLWSDRFKGVIVDKGEAQLACSSYIDLNPVRANMVERPEDYRWSSMGLRVRNPWRANKLLGLIFETEVEKEKTFPESKFICKGQDMNQLSWYREFVYASGGVEREGKGKINTEMIKDVKRFHSRLGIGNRFAYRMKNISEGVAIGSFTFIANFQKQNNRKFIRPRPFLEGKSLFGTRVLRL